MGTIINRTMVVSLFHEDHAEVFEAFLVELGAPYYRHQTEINRCHEFWLPNSGSKLGWPTDDRHREQIAAVCDWLDAKNKADEVYSSYVVVDFDECTPRIERSDEDTDG